MERYGSELQTIRRELSYFWQKVTGSMKVCDITSGMAHDLHKKLKHDRQGRSQAKHTTWLSTQNKRLSWIEKQFSKVNKEHGEGRANFAESEKPQERKTNLLNWKEKAELKLQELNSPKTKIDRQGSYSANRTIQLLKAVVNFGKKFKSYSGDNPFDGITLYKEEKRKRFLTDNEAARLFDALDKLEGDTRDIITLLLLTGTRKSNVLSLRWDEICWNTQTWTITETKNGESQTIPLGHEEQSILLARWNAASQAKLIEYVYPGRGATGHIVFPRRSRVSVCRQANLKNFTMHDLRRSLAAKMASSRVNIAIVKGVMGHKNIKTTLRAYAHTTQSAQLEARLAAHDAWRDMNKNRKKTSNTG
jgi:integrase